MPLNLKQHNDARRPTRFQMTTAFYFLFFLRILDIGIIKKKLCKVTSRKKKKKTSLQMHKRHLYGDADFPSSCTKRPFNTICKG